MNNHNRARGSVETVRRIGIQHEKRVVHSSCSQLPATPGEERQNLRQTAGAGEEELDQVQVFFFFLLPGYLDLWSPLEAGLISSNRKLKNITQAQIIWLINI